MRELFLKRASWDSLEAGWSVSDSVNIIDLIPVWTLPGGGILKKDLISDYQTALELAINYTERHIKKAQRHLEMLILESERLNDNSSSV